MHLHPYRKSRFASICGTVYRSYSISHLQKIMSEKVEEANDFKAFFEALNAQEKALSPRVTDDSLGVILRIAVNELDWYSYNLARASDPTFDQEEYFYLLHIGVTRLIKLALETRTSFDAPTIMYRRTPEIILPALEVAGGLGMIEHGETHCSKRNGRCRSCPADRNIGICNHIARYPAR